MAGLVVTKSLSNIVEVCVDIASIGANHRRSGPGDGRTKRVTRTKPNVHNHEGL